MPIYLRRFYYGKLVDAKNKEKEEMDKNRSKSSSVQRPNIQKPPTPPKFRR